MFECLHTGARGWHGWRECATRCAEATAAFESETRRKDRGGMETSARSRRSARGRRIRCTARRLTRSDHGISPLDAACVLCIGVLCHQVHKYISENDGDSIVRSKRWWQSFQVVSKRVDAGRAWSTVRSHRSHAAFQRSQRRQPRLGKDTRYVTLLQPVSFLLPTWSSRRLSRASCHDDHNMWLLAANSHPCAYFSSYPSALQTKRWRMVNLECMNLQPSIPTLATNIAAAKATKTLSHLQERMHAPATNRCAAAPSFVVFSFPLFQHI